MFRSSIEIISIAQTITGHSPGFIQLQVFIDSPSTFHGPILYARPAPSSLAHFYFQVVISSRTASFLHAPDSSCHLHHSLNYTAIKAAGESLSPTHYTVSSLGAASATAKEPTVDHSQGRLNRQDTKTSSTPLLLPQPTEQHGLRIIQPANRRVLPVEPLVLAARGPQAHS